MSVTWISKQKKQELIDLSNEIGYALEDGLKKDEIVENLHEYLQTNATRLSNNASLEGYYGNAAGRRTPFKARDEVAVSSDEPDVTEVKSVVRGRGRRTTKVKQEPADDSDYASPTALAKTAASALSSAVLSPFSHNAQASSSTRTPAPTRRSTRRKSELPASPSDIADLAEYESAAMATRVSEIYENLGIADNIEYFREVCSSVPAVHLTFGVLEAFALLKALMPWKYAFDIPAIDALHTPSYAVKLPDLFVFLTGYWWSTSLLWASTSILVPLLFGYFFNLTVRNVGRTQTRKYTIDPLTFSVVKGLATWLVYCQGVDFGGILGPDVAQRVDTAILGGHTAVLVGSGISALASLYEAAQTK